MAKPGRRERTPSTELQRFTNRDGERALFHRWLGGAEEPPVLMFYGIGGAGKTWLLKKLREESDVPCAYVDLEGQRMVADWAPCLATIREQLGVETPRFDLTVGMLRYKEVGTAEPAFRGEGVGGLAFEVAAEFAQAAQKGADAVPGVNVGLNWVGRKLRERLRGSGLEKWVAGKVGGEFLLGLRAMTKDEIRAGLIGWLAEDLRSGLAAVGLNRTVRAVVLLDTFEALAMGVQYAEHQNLREAWVRDLAAEFDFGLVVLAGQNRVNWDDLDPAWAEEAHLSQHLVGGLSEQDARVYLERCGVAGRELQDAMLRVADDADSPGYHCFSLGLCADIAWAEQQRGVEVDPATFALRPGDWEALARRFLKSLGSDEERRWIERLAVTPRFDGAAGRAAFAEGASAAREHAWETLEDYSFVLRGAGGWWSIRAQMRWALESQPSARERVAADQEWWRGYWGARSEAAVDEPASLAWYHAYHLDAEAAITAWEALAEGARTAVPARMAEHYSLLAWWDPVGLLERAPGSRTEARRCVVVGVQRARASQGNRNRNLEEAIRCFEAALHSYREGEFPKDWAATQHNLGNVWRRLPTGVRGDNLMKAIQCYEAALRVRTRKDLPEEWAATKNGLGNTWADAAGGDLGSNLKKAIQQFEAALEVRTEKAHPEKWAATQNNLGIVWRQLPTGDSSWNIRKAIACHQAALRVYAEGTHPWEWAPAQMNLGVAWAELPTGILQENLKNAIECNEAALRIYTETTFPEEWAKALTNMGNAWTKLRAGDRGQHLNNAIDCYQAALRVHPKASSPRDWAETQFNLGRARAEIRADREENLKRAIESYRAALRVYSEAWFPRERAMTQYMLGATLASLSTGNREENLIEAIICYETALLALTKEAFPREWAGLQNNIGAAWAGMTTGERGKNLDRAIRCFETALQVFTEEAFPSEWADLQNNLGAAWVEVTTNEVDRNIKKAIDYYQAALRVHTEAGFPWEWASIQNNLGAALVALSAGNKQENLRTAIWCFQEAMRERKEAEHPIEWAVTQSNLGAASAAIPTTDDPETLNRALGFYDAALRVLTEESSPQQWATTKWAYGLALMAMEDGDRAGLLREAVGCFEAALGVFGEGDYRREAVEASLREAREELEGL